ncbi:hypothetical protein [Pedococcus bigeumensis]|uniref:Gram-positive cocci surface proteins LPxTG domain-containing protein n=1 Tax=Pedococcus bigeumensis TaxID=433644 RepID=A0A502D3H5_9MICO|nr:hypothetical protein [Pedococcus bigeumensis]TPG19474.1 hypothetical protein EAH86_03145 [Pedococcus bigeumensis]
MRTVARLTAVAGLVVAGGLTLPGGAAQAAACSGTSGVTVVIDYGSSSTTSCASGDPTSAMSALRAVAAVVSPQRYPGTVVCRINGTPASDPCIQMPPADAYWAFYHALRGGSWTYSQVGVAGYNPAPGSVIGFAFGSGGAPSSAPPAAAPKPQPKPTPRPSPSSSSSKPPAAKPKPAGTTPAKPSGSSTSGTTPQAGSAASGSSAGPTPGVKPSATTVLPNDSTSTAATGSVTVSPNGSTGSGERTAAAAADPGSGTPMTLLAGLGLVGLVGAGAAYLAVRRRTTT